MGKKAGKILLEASEARAKIFEGAKAIYTAVATTYGPRGANLSIEKNFGFPLLVRDGATVAKDVYFSDPAKNQGAQYLYQASEATNRLAGDGTTATVVFTYHLLALGHQAIAAGVHPMTLKAQLHADRDLLLDNLATLSKPTKPSQLKEVATVSSGDPLIGQLIAEAVEYVGPNGGINAEKAPVESIERDYVDGYFVNSGFTALQDGKKELLEPMVIVLQKRVASAVDIGDILQRAFIAKGVMDTKGQIVKPVKLLLMGNVDAAAYMHCVNLINQNAMDAVILKTPPQFGEMGMQLLEDIAVYAGCEPISESTNLREVGSNHVGEIGRVVASKLEATLYGDNSGELVQDRIAALKSQIDTEAVDAIREKLKDRLAKLEGKIAIFRIGGATDTAKEETEFRVEDSILATRAAVAHGVVPGGGITLLELSKAKELSELTRNALHEVFKKLLTNANLPEQVKLAEALAAKPGWGFNLRESDELVNLVDAGILDPTLVVENIIRNACTMAADLLSIGCMIVNEEKE